MPDTNRSYGKFFLPCTILAITLAFLLTGCNPSSVGVIMTPSSSTYQPQPTPNLGRTCFEGGCHAGLKVRESRYLHKPYEEGLCLDCHKVFHNSQTQKKATVSDIILCYGCHPQRTLGNTHPVGEGVIDPITRQMMTCTSTCHRSHTAPYPYLLSLAPNGELCVYCHKEFIHQ